jgi:hypothetical protein
MKIAHGPIFGGEKQDDEAEESKFVNLESDGCISRISEGFKGRGQT